MDMETLEKDVIEFIKGDPMPKVGYYRYTEIRYALTQCCHAWLYHS